jgi:CheY-like chemotaxis protein
MSPPKPSATATRPLRVLIVEDNPDGREMLCLLLEMAGHQVEAAADGQEGLELALRDHPDVAVIDIGLPRLDGYALAQRLRAAFGPDIYLITHTSYGQPEDRRRALAAGFDVHLTKPVDPQDLYECLDHVPAR